MTNKHQTEAPTAELTEEELATAQGGTCRGITASLESSKAVETVRSAPHNKQSGKASGIVDMGLPDLCPA